jgi:hypothetical protein
MARAELVRVLYRLGCRTAPAKWHPRHIKAGFSAPGARETEGQADFFFEHVVLLHESRPQRANAGSHGSGAIRATHSSPTIICGRGTHIPPALRAVGPASGSRMSTIDNMAITAGIVEVDDIRGAAGVGEPGRTRVRGHPQAVASAVALRCRASERRAGARRYFDARAPSVRPSVGALFCLRWMPTHGRAGSHATAAQSFEHRVRDGSRYHS